MDKTEFEPFDNMEDEVVPTAKLWTTHRLRHAVRRHHNTSGTTA